MKAKIKNVIAVSIIPAWMLLFYGFMESSVQVVNPVIGDKSFEVTFGCKPDAATDENLRIKTHLEYVEQLLRKQNVAALPEPLQQHRKQILNLLHSYCVSGIFPHNYDYHGKRLPCFIDKEGRICAVGYLVEKTAGRETAERINSKHKYEKLLAMNDNLLEEWIAGSGLTKVECAMIQPQYGWQIQNPNYNHITPSYGIFSSLLSGVNASLNGINAIQMFKGKGDNILPVAGLIAGTGQLVLGAGMFPKEMPDINGNNTTNESEKILSMINIGIGTATIIISTANLIANQRLKNARTSWNLYSMPGTDNKFQAGLSFTKRF